MSSINYNKLPIQNGIRVYILPFDDNGTYQSTWIDISKYITSIGQISKDIDSTDYQIGLYRCSNVSLVCNNRTGKFGYVDETESFFRYKRTDTQVKICYRMCDDPPVCGLAKCGDAWLGEEVELFKGLLSDEPYKADTDKEDAEFTVLGLETLFDRAIVPYSSVGNGDLISELLYTILNQGKITSLLTVDAANIVPDQDQTADDVSWLENKTVKQAIDKLLLVSNSVMYVEDDTIYVKSRDVSATLKQTFYGQASQNGVENIINIDNYNNGLQRVFNFWTWKSSAALTSDSTSAIKWGYRKKEIDFEVFTNTTKQTNLLAALRDEFSNPKTEMDLTVPFNYDTIDINLLDKVNIDYPTVVYPSDSNPLPLFGAAISGVAKAPNTLYSMRILDTSYFKVLKKSLDLNNLRVVLKLREV